MRLFLSMFLAAAIAASSAISVTEAAPIADQSAVRQTAIDLRGVEKAQFVWGGRNYCWYDTGWRGPGWYWCGYAWRSGLGWGGGLGWHGWRWHGHRGGHWQRGRGGHHGGRGRGGHRGGHGGAGHRGGHHGGGRGGHRGGGGRARR
jgi:hypothetical protein